MTQIHFEGILSPWFGLLLAICGAIAIWFWYRRETVSLSKPWPIVLPALRSVAVALMLAMLTGPILSRQWLSGSLANIVVLIDESSSMLLEDHNQSMHRSARVADWLEGDGDRAGWLADQMRGFQVQVVGFGSSDARRTDLRVVWDSAVHPRSEPIRVELKADGAQSAIGQALETIASGAGSPTAMVLITDGQSNSGVAMSEVADRLRVRQIPVFAVGMGVIDEPNDLALLAVDHPKSMIASDVFQGVATVKQQLPDRTPYQLTIRKDGKILWTERFIADGNSIRTIDYRFEGESLFEGVSEDGASGNRSIPLDLEFDLEFDGEDAIVSNNRLESSLWGVTQKNRVVIVDRRGRWESRYIKNAFERDSAWLLDAVLGPSEFDARGFPASRDDLIACDLMIATMETASGWSDLQKRWIADHVAESGAGFIWIDSGRESSAGDALSDLDWLPVTFDTRNRVSPIRRLELSSTAWGERAFAFEADEQANSKLWASFPAPRVARRVAEKPGAEVFVAGRTESDRSLPMLVASRFGQGKVIYIANDESWRWRYNVADLYHQRFWNQIAQWTMQAPFALENEFASFDVGDRTNEVGGTISVRALLKNADRSPMTGARAYAVIQENGVRIDTIPLSEYPAGSGMYAGVSPPLAEGKFTLSLEVPGVPAENTPWHSDVLVRAKANAEFQSLSQNRFALQQLAEKTSGAYVDESEREKLSEILRPRQTGKIEESRWPLWQSYPWFIAVVALLSVEWFLRKRAGLV